MAKIQVDIGSAHKIISPKLRRASHQSLARLGASYNANNMAVFDKIYVFMYFFNIDGNKYAKDSVISIMTQMNILIKIEALINFIKSMLKTY